MNKIVGLFSVAALSTLANAGEKPNIVLINADDLGYGDLSCYGATKLQTPNIDALAKAGRRFTDAHSSSAVCSPSRYGLLTGVYPSRAALWGPLSGRDPLIISQDRMTLPKVLKQAGYQTAIVGKWHLGLTNGEPDFNKELTPGPKQVGFDYHFILPVVNSGAPFVYVENSRMLGYDPKDPLVRGGKFHGQIIEEKSKGPYGGAKKAHELYDDYKAGLKFTEVSLNWMKKQTDKPFFLNLMTTNIHHPFTPAKRFQGTSQCGLYGDFVHELDWIVGQVTNAAEEIGRKTGRETLIIFTSDNGGMLNMTGQKAWDMGHRLNGKLLGYKFGTWEGGHRVPFIVKWTGKVPAGTQSDSLVSQLDLLATFAEITGQTINDKNDSISQLNEFLGTNEKPNRDEVMIFSNSIKHVSVRTKRWLFIPNTGSGGFMQKWGGHLTGGAAAMAHTKQLNNNIMNGKWKADAPVMQLYDLENDPYQTTNVLNKYPEVVNELHEKVKNHISEIPKDNTKGWLYGKYRNLTTEVGAKDKAGVKNKSGARRRKKKK